MGQQWHVLLVLLILTTTLFFAHSLTRLGIEFAGGRAEDGGEEEVGFVPEVPIEVEMVGAGAPPGYGVWRCS